MSANEKELRAAQKAERKAAAAAEADKKNRSFRRNAIIVAVIFVVLIAFALLVNSNYFYTHTTALTVGSTKYSPAEVNYFYRSTYNGIYQNLYNQLGDSTSMILDRNTPLDQQLYPYGEDENMTWADAIKDAAQQDMVRVTALYDAAVRAGRTLTADEQSAVDSDLAQMTTYATGNGYASQNEEKEATRLREEVEDAKYRALTLSSELMDRTRQSHIEEHLRQIGDSALKSPTSSPYILTVDTAE